jgi:hypothetical protein
MRTGAFSEGSEFFALAGTELVRSLLRGDGYPGEI